MLAELEPREIVYWRAARETIPLDDGWKQADTIAGAIHDEFASYFAHKAGKKEIPKSWLHKVGSYIPKLRLRKRERVTVDQASIDLTQSILESHFLG